jgi:ribosomal protein S18 acetylase RimI-like enzyme
VAIMPDDDGALLRRCIAFELERDLEIAERVERYPWGRSFLSPTIPLVWDASWILVEQAGMSAAQVVEAADEAIGSEGMRHRTVVVLDDSDGARLVPGFAALGWDIDRAVYMVWRRAPDRGSQIDVAERPLDEILGLRRGLIRTGLLGTEKAETVEQLLEWDRRIGESDGDRWFVAPVDGEPASGCRLLARDGIGQVEDVGTLPEARGRGFARAVTLAAARASRADGNGLTYLGAEADNWPRRLYTKLGFDEVGYLHEFQRKPDANP